MYKTLEEYRHLAQYWRDLYGREVDERERVRVVLAEVDTPSNLTVREQVEYVCHQFELVRRQLFALGLPVEGTAEAGLILRVIREYRDVQRLLDELNVPKKKTLRERIEWKVEHGSDNHE